VRAAIQAQIQVTCLPGPTAFVPALVMSGIPCDRFYFGGFLPPKKGRKTRWEFMASLPCTLVLYESPHRIQKTLKEAVQFCGGERQAAVVREISKLFEEAIRGNLSELEEKSKQSTWKGEMVLVIGSETCDQ
jgi:16S rRNA (cytidine1402-2'-O)-methyltransferase